MGKGLLSPQQVNERNRMFWDVQSKLRAERISSEAILEIAINDVRSETSKVSIRLQKPFDQALADAEKTMNIVQSAFSRKGGKAPKRDALQILIQDIVIQKPKITAGQLLYTLKSIRGAGTVTSIEEESDVRGGEPRMIHYVDDSRTPKTASLSGLKDRLSRAKRKIVSR
jgi:hypothetical protein